MGRKYKEQILFCIFCVIMTLLLTEIGFQIIHANANKDIISKTFLKRLIKFTEPPFSWERYFLTNYEKGKMGFIPNLEQDGMHQPHATRGWALKPNISITKNGKTYTSNSDGFRSLYEFHDDPNKYEVLIIGDSFTFGDGIDDSVTWPHLLQQLDKDLNVFNLGGSGYGIDQMYITLSEAISQYHPKLVVAAFIDNDLHRSLLDFRDYKKPRFVIKNNKLVMTNIPIGGIEEVISKATRSKKDDYSPIQIINVFNYIRRKLKLTDYIREPERSDYSGGCDHDCTALNEKLFEKMAEMAKQNNAEFLVIYLPYGSEIFDQKFLSYGEYFFDNYKMDHEHYFLNPRKELLDLSRQKSHGHYRRSENIVVSRLVYDKIKKLSSWKDFNDQMHPGEIE